MADLMHREVTASYQIVDRLRRVRNRYFFALDALSIVASTMAAYVLRFEGWSWTASEAGIAAVYLLAAVPCLLALYWGIGLYRTLWRYASVIELERLLLAGGFGAAAMLGLGAVIFPHVGIVAHRVPYSVLIISGVVQAVFLAAPRFFVRSMARHKGAQHPEATVRRALIVGAGAAAGLIVKELHENRHLGIKPVGLVDDDPSKQGKLLHGVPIVGALPRLADLIVRTGATEVIIAMPTAPGRIVREVVKLANEAGVPTNTMPGMYELISGQKSVNRLRRVEIQDLLRRDVIQTDLEQVRSLAAGKTVLVTGAGGSIGSELCRQIARLSPKMIVALGRGENSIFELLQEFSRTFPQVRIEPVIADVRHHAHLREVFETYRPHTVFHAAAHKHVPLMERSVAEAVLNNVVGTRNAVTLSSKVGVEHFVLVSTDKAIRPTSVMGVTKRIAEGVVHDEAVRTGHKYVAVRFGNVLGSRGSVVPVFLQQIAAGGPVNVTHPDMRRYFMTIPEAVQLVLQAGALAQGSEVFVLDMGEQVRIADLAADLIRLSGFEVGTDVEIRFTGVRPGEKLYEEMFFSADNASPTVHPKILRATNADLPNSVSMVVEELIAAAQGGHPAEEMRQLLKRIVPEYGTPSSATLTLPPVQPTFAGDRKQHVAPMPDVMAQPSSTPSSVSVAM